jgi:dTDP-4-amino-4,6-dideoxygalactose transaminase
LLDRARPRTARLRRRRSGHACLSPGAVAELLERMAAPPGRAVLLPVHLFGARPIARPPCSRAATTCLVEDAAQAFGARRRSMVEVRLAASAYPTKNPGVGDGGR